MPRSRTVYGPYIGTSVDPPYAGLPSVKWRLQKYGGGGGGLNTNK